MANNFRAIGATTFLAPIPAVMLSCRGTEPGFDRDNLITVAWAGVVNSDPPMVSVSIRPSRHSYAQILQSGAFCLNLIDQPLREIEGFPAPALDEAPAFLCCRVKQRIPLGSHDLFLCAVEQVYVKDALFDADGSLHMGRANLVSYAHGEYFPLKPRPEGFFGYSVAREDVLRRRLGAPKPAARRTPEKRNGRR